MLRVRSTLTSSLFFCLLVALSGYCNLHARPRGRPEPIPPAFPLSHFLGPDLSSPDAGGPDTAQLLAGSSLCLGCPKLDGAELRLADYDVQTEQREISLGQAQGETQGQSRRIVEIHIHFQTKPEVKLALPEGGTPVDGHNYFIPNPVDLKLLVVEQSPGQFREFYRLEAEADVIDSVDWAAMLKVDGQAVLVSYDPWSGNGGLCSEGYWQVDSQGVHPIDFSQVDRAMASRTPPGSSLVQTRCWALHMGDATIQSWAQKPNSCHACGYTAQVDAHFHLHGNHAIPDKVAVKPIDTPQ